MPLTHVMLAREETPRLLARALFRYWMTSRGYLVQVGILLAVALGAALVLRSTLSVVVVVAVLVLTPALLYVRCQRSARAYAPPGFTLGLGLGATHLALRHAVATTVTPYVSWQSVERLGDAVILRTPRGGVPRCPRSSCSPRWRSCRPSSGRGPNAATRSAGRRRAPAARLRCTRSTRSQLAWAATIRQVLTPGMLVLAAVDLLLLVSPLVLRGMPWFWAAFPIGLTLVGVAAGWWSAWRRLAVSASPGMVIRAGLRDDALVIEDSTARPPSPTGGRPNVRHAERGPGPVTATQRRPLPARRPPRCRGSVARRARWSGSGAADELVPERHRPPSLTRGLGMPCAGLAVASRVASGPGRPCRRKHLCGGGSTC